MLGNIVKYDIQYEEAQWILNSFTRRIETLLGDIFWGMLTLFVRQIVVLRRIETIYCLIVIHMIDNDS